MLHKCIVVIIDIKQFVYKQHDFKRAQNTMKALKLNDCIVTNVDIIILNNSFRFVVVVVFIIIFKILKSKQKFI